MNHRLGTAFVLCLFAFTISVSHVFAQRNTTDEVVSEAVIDSVVTIFLAADGQSSPVGSGLIVRSDGYILTPFSLVRGAREIQVRLRNGETYDKAEIVSTDERRNLAIIRINAAGLRYIPYGTSEEGAVGSKIAVLANPNGQVVVRNDLLLNSVQMADSIPGAGKGYRLMQFDPIAGVNSVGGLLLDPIGRSLGIITTTSDIKGQNIAVPLSSVMGMIRSASANYPAVATTISTSPSGYPAAPTQTPYPIPQSSVLVPERGVTQLPSKGPGSVVVKPKTVPEILAVSRTIYVTSRTVTFKPDQMVNALNSRPEMAEWNLSFVDERDLADLILEIDHELYTYKYTFKLFSERMGTVIATGSRIIWDGNLGAPYMADRFIEKVKAVRGAGSSSPSPDTKKAPVDDKKINETKSSGGASPTKKPEPH